MAPHLKISTTLQLKEILSLVYIKFVQKINLREYYNVKSDNQTVLSLRACEVQGLLKKERKKNKEGMMSKPKIVAK